VQDLLGRAGRGSVLRLRPRCGLSTVREGGAELSGVQEEGPERHEAVLRGVGLNALTRFLNHRGVPDRAADVFRLNAEGHDIGRIWNGVKPVDGIWVNGQGVLGLSFFFLSFIIIIIRTLLRRLKVGVYSPSLARCSGRTYLLRVCNMTIVPFIAMSSSVLIYILHCSTSEHRLPVVCTRPNI